MKGGLAATITELRQLQPAGGVGFVLFGVVIALFADGTLKSDRCASCFLCHMFLYFTG